MVRWLSTLSFSATDLSRLCACRIQSGTHIPLRFEVCTDKLYHLQGVFSGVLAMHSFDTRMQEAVNDSGRKGWLVAILELGAWAGVLMTGAFLSLILPRYPSSLRRPVCEREQRFWGFAHSRIALLRPGYAVAENSAGARLILGYGIVIHVPMRFGIQRLLSI